MNRKPRLLLCKNLVYRDLRLFYGGSRGHAFFTFLVSLSEPLSLILVYILVIGKVMKVGDSNFGIFVAVGYLHWHLGVNILNASCTAVTRRASLVTHAPFDRLELPLSTVFSELCRYIPVIFAVLVICLLNGSQLWFGVALYPLFLALQLVALTGLSFTVSSLQVFYNDVRGFIGLIVRILFWTSPIVYSPRLLPEWLLEPMSYCNPAFAFLQGYRDIWVYQELPTLKTWTLAIVWGVLFLFFGLRLFRRLEGSFANEL